MAHLCLNEIGGNNFAAVSVEERESGAERGERDTPDDALSNDTPPAGLCFVNGLIEEVVEQERFKILVLLVRGGDVTEEDGLDNAAATPHLRNAGVVEVPAHLES